MLEGVVLIAVGALDASLANKISCQSAKKQQRVAVRSPVPVQESTTMPRQRTQVPAIPIAAKNKIGFVDTEETKMVSVAIGTVWWR
jgi:hypothetical protein